MSLSSKANTLRSLIEGGHILIFEIFLTPPSLFTPVRLLIFSLAETNVLLIVYSMKYLQKINTRFVFSAIYTKEWSYLLNFTSESGILFGHFH